MATKAQIAANRRNGSKSKGPSTEEGRAAASRNSLKHGLTAEQVVLVLGEAEDDFGRFHEEMRTAMQPVDALEEQLVERIVLCAWRLRRAYRAEAGTMNDEFDEVRKYRQRHGLNNGWTPHDGVAFSRAAWKFEAISRYEATIERALHRALMTLERRQARRRDEPVLAPIALQIEGAAADDLVERASGAALEMVQTELVPELAPSPHLAGETG